MIDENQKTKLNEDSLRDVAGGSGEIKNDYYDPVECGKITEVETRCVGTGAMQGTRCYHYEKYISFDCTHHICRMGRFNYLLNTGGSGSHKG